MAYCIKCGAENPAEAVYCHRCGVLLHQSDSGLTGWQRLRANPAALLIALNVLLLLVIEAVLLFVVPIFAAMFADFGARLPAPTQLLLDGSTLLRQSWWLLNPLLFLVVRAVARFAVGQIPARTWLWLGLLAQLILLGAIVMAMFLPIFQLGAVAGGM